MMDGKTYAAGTVIALDDITESCVKTITYTVEDPYNYNADGTQVEEPVIYTLTLTLNVTVTNPQILAPVFVFVDQNGKNYTDVTTATVGEKTYIMPANVTADNTSLPMDDINIGSTTISGTAVTFPITTGYTVRNNSSFNRYYPLFTGVNITDYTDVGDTAGTTYTSGNDHTSFVGSDDTYKFVIPANATQTDCGDYVQTAEQSGNAAGNSSSGWQGAGYNTNYGGTYLKSGDTSASSGNDKNGYERIVWVEYHFNAGNGDKYYYRIGYHCNKVSALSCFTGDTLITLADGTQKQIQDLTYEDKLLTWDFFTGEYTEQDISILVNHGAGNYQVANMEFADGSVLKIVGDHGVFDYDLNQYVYITTENVQDYIGHRFVQYSPDGSYQIITMTNGYVTEEYTGSYSITSAATSNAFASGILTVAPPGDFYNWIEMGDTLRYDTEQFAADVEQYGLYTYEDFAGYVTYEQFVAFNGAYLKIPVEKGLFTFDYILELIALYGSYMPQ